MNLGEITAVAVNSKGHVFILSRSNNTGNVFGGAATQLFEFDEDGRFVREIGRGVYGFAFGHGVRVDKDDNVWVVDKGSNMVMKFNPTGHVVMVLGRREEPTDEHIYPDRSKASVQVDGMFNQPTDVAWDAAGNIFISDGYVNSRVAKYDKTGAWVKSWGTRGYGPGQFNLPHSIAVDYQGRVYVADRANGRLQVFDGDGKFLNQIIIDVPAPPGARPLLGYQIPPPADAPAGSILTYRPGSPAAICIPPGQSQVIFVGDLFPARIYKLTLDGKVLGVFGRGGKMPGQISGIHGLACPSENVVYTAEFINWRSQKFILHPERIGSK
jgi:DNA-binding beta-propeller fold protein YncE